MFLTWHFNAATGKADRIGFVLKMKESSFFKSNNEIVSN